MRNYANEGDNTFCLLCTDILRQPDVSGFHSEPEFYNFYPERKVLRQ